MMVWVVTITITITIHITTTIIIIISGGHMGWCKRVAWVVPVVG